MRRRLLGVVGGAAAATLLAAACAAPRNTLGTSSSTCFRAIPTAKAAVHHKGKLLGVRRMHRDTVARVLPAVGTVRPRDVCVVGFRGPYRSDEVDAPGPGPSGRYALVVVSHRGTTLLKTVLADRLPLRLGHL
jgi:hypothetical protein